MFLYAFFIRAKTYLRNRPDGSSRRGNARGPVGSQSERSREASKPRVRLSKFPKSIITNRMDGKDRPRYKVREE